MIWYILLAGVAVLAVIALFAASKPDEWTVQREEVMPGGPAAVFPHMDDLLQFLKWSPWAKLDPAMKVTPGERMAGRGAHFSWTGNGRVGAGTLTITESRPHDLVRYRFDFSKPLQCTNTHEFALKAEGSQTRVTWTIKGHAPFYFKLILVFASCDTMMAKDLEVGLADLKAIVAG